MGLWKKTIFICYIPLLSLLYIIYTYEGKKKKNRLVSAYFPQFSLLCMSGIGGDSPIVPYLF